MGQWKDESGSERRPCETVMDVKEPRRTTHNAGRVDCREYAGSWPYARNGRKQERSAIRRTSRYGSMPKSESLRILKRAGRAECREHRERSRGKRGTYDSAMPLSFPAIEQLRYLWGGPPGPRPTPRRPVAGVKDLDPSSGERVQGDPPRPGIGVKISHCILLWFFLS